MMANWVVIIEFVFASEKVGKTGGLSRTLIVFLLWM